MRLLKLLVIAALAVVWISLGAKDPAVDSRLKNSFRKPAQDGWTYVHLEGTPSEIGFQHGWLLAPEIVDGLNVQKVELEHDSEHKWDFYRDAARDVLWPHIEKEYQDELQGIADGLKAKNIKLDLWDIVAVNAAMEWEYYTRQYDKQHGKKSPKTVVAPEHCSAFVATGSYTKDGKPVIGHNNWTSYMDGPRWTIAFDVKPVKGHHFVMDGYPGLIHSADDFGVNDAGIVITETTITGFEGFDPNGVAEFVRARKAMQYSESIDDFARIMQDGNNGGYANDWLVADTRRNEIASLELGLKNVELKRTKDGYFAGANYPINEKLLKEETNFDAKNPQLSSNARRIRWDDLMLKNKGGIDAAMGKKFLGDHFDVTTGREQPSEHTLCGHVDLSSRGMGDWKAPYEPAGTVQNKIADAAMAAKMSFQALAGHACGIDFKAKNYLAEHPQFNWTASILKDMPAHKWTAIKGQ